MEHDKRFVKGFLCGLCVTALCGLVAYFVVGEITRYWVGREIAQNETQAQTGKESVNLDNTAILKKMEEIEGVINESYLNQADPQEVENQIYKGLLKGLEDPYSGYYTEEELAKLKESTSGTYSGIGATMSQNKDTGVITIVRCFEGTPSEEAGLLPGDIIYMVDDAEVTGMDLSVVVSLIKTGKNDKVHLSVVREGISDYVEVDVERREIQVPTVESEMLKDQIGYISILEFDSVTEKQFEDAMNSLEKQGMEKLIIDLRDNPGGILQVVCKMLDRILPEGLIVYTEDKYGNRKEYKSDDQNQFTKPIALLVNGNSASASEIFAGAIKDYGVGTIVGTTTFGKGIVQRIENLSDGTAVKLTIEKYFTPKGNNIHGVGIEPDVEVELDKELRSKIAITKEEDNQLQKAIEVLK